MAVTPRGGRPDRPEATRRAHRPPNILLITADQMRADCLSAAGHPVVRTPHLDALAARGVHFEHAITPYPVCVPARLSILSGQYPHTHGVMDNRGMIPMAQANIARTLRDAGYRTAALGKMHFWPPYAQVGFETMQLAEQDGQGFKIDDYHSVYLAERGLIDQWDYWDQHKPYRAQAPAEYWQTFGARASELGEEHYHTGWIADRSIDYVNRDDARPFFIWTSFIKPHHPFDPPAPWDALYDPAVIPPAAPQTEALAKPLLTNGAQRDPRKGYFDMSDLTPEQYRRVAAHYYGSISHIDHHVGRIVQALAARGELERTLIIFTSDHGDYMGDYGLILKSPSVPYGSLAHVPMIVAGPGVAGGRTSSALVSLIDLFPTAAAAAGASVPASVHGRDLGGVLRGEVADAALRDAVFSETREVKAVRTQRYAYLYNHRRRLEELYDLAEDPGEKVDRAGDPALAGVVRQLREHLLHWLLETEWGDRNAARGTFSELRLP
ncbi:MAG TPA: sulfatase-like hydrolase/transferase [Limnochordia bacterium]|nr:sulfatase-like hydrolase/transferase [Limnochordia bacterium]